MSNTGTNTSWGSVYPNYYNYLTGLNPSFYSQQTSKIYRPVSGITVITSNTAREVQGTYSGVVRNTQTNVTATITAGKFRARKQ